MIKPTDLQNIVSAIVALDAAQDKLYSIAGGSIDSGNAKAARMTSQERLDYFRSDEFRHWVACERAAGRQVFWLKDVDKTQGAGDIFTFFFKWRADNGKFTVKQLAVIADFLEQRKNQQAPMSWPARILSAIKKACQSFGPSKLSNNGAASDLGPHEALRLWLNKEAGGDGIAMMDFWTNIYWPSQVGLSKAEKLAQVTAFAPLYANKAYPGVKEENELLTSLGVTVVIVSNGDQELAIAVAPVLGVKPENVVGSHLIYDKSGISTGVNHSYEVGGEEWHSKPQPGKPLSFHYWLHVNRARFGWSRIDERKFVIAGRDGDSASTDGGMMILMHPCAIGNFMINTPSEPARLEKFVAVASKYGWTVGQFITLDHSPSKTGYRPD
ncbi:hypothetical protein KBI23_23330 [bacterium]|nr:hypothetical protein [bacterium]MBP9809770.1 hypothetical protein [bacterium]